jgi:Bax protein
VAFGGLLLLWFATRGEPVPDFAAIDSVAQKKQSFFTYVGSRVAATNATVLADRRRLEALRDELAAHGSLSWFEQRWLNDLAERYELDRTGIDSDRALIAALLRRVDVIPASLALVQAAKESGWGTARFAVEGRNLFGQRCFAEGCGLVPARRAAGRGYEVAEFNTVQASVDAYVHNLNTHPRYSRLREIRARLRQARSLSGAALADGLLGYSERGKAYVQEVKAMIRQNALE